VVVVVVVVVHPVSTFVPPSPTCARHALALLPLKSILCGGVCPAAAVAVASSVQELKDRFLFGEPPKRNQISEALLPLCQDEDDLMALKDAIYT
jgi:hypothetical protein